MAKIALLFGTTVLGHLVLVVIPISGLRPRNGDDHDNQMTKIGRPKNEGDLGHGHRLFCFQLLWGRHRCCALHCFGIPGPGCCGSSRDVLRKHEMAGLENVDGCVFVFFVFFWGGAAPAARETSSNVVE